MDIWILLFAVCSPEQDKDSYWEVEETIFYLAIVCWMASVIAYAAQARFFDYATVLLDVAILTLLSAIAYFLLSDIGVRSCNRALGWGTICATFLSFVTTAMFVVKFIQEKWSLPSPFG